MKKLPASVVPIDFHRTFLPGPDQPPQPTPPASHPPNKWTRRSFIRMFCLGNGVWKIARHHRVLPSTVESEIRERLIESGEFQKAA